MRLLAALRRLDAWALPRLADSLNQAGGRARRARIPLLAAGAALVLLFAVALWRVGPAGAPTDAGPSLRVGVGAGESVAAYLTASRTELRRLARHAPGEDVYALLTLAAYLAPDRVVPLATGLSVSAVFVRVPLPGADTRVVKIDAFRVPEDIVAGMDQVAVRFDGEVLDYEELLSRMAGTDERTRQLRVSYLAQRARASAEAAALRASCSCVYALVVRGTAASLARVARRSELRIVDAAPEVRRLDRTVFLPPLPEHRSTPRAGAARVPKVPKTG